MDAAEVTAFARKWGLLPESHAYLDAVIGWRDAFKPADDSVRVVLLAESHVAEQPALGDPGTAVRIPSQLHPALAASSSAPPPERYVRLVYCLGYGEPELCAGPLEAKSNTGTIQYWDLFGAVAHGSVSAKQPRRGETPGPDGLRRRVGWKLDVLARLGAKGVWLMDASPAALYVPGGARPLSGSRYKQVVQDSFARFIQPSLEGFRNLAQVWVIGRDLGSCLVGPDSYHRLRRDRVISQPQDRDAQRYGADLARMVAAIG